MKPIIPLVRKDPSGITNVGLGQSVQGSVRHGGTPIIKDINICITQEYHTAANTQRKEMPVPQR
jgi:hypothetical protein